MKRHIRASGLTALTLSALTTMNCTTEKVDAAYIGPSQIEIQDGKMTPEVAAAIGMALDRELGGEVYAAIALAMHRYMNETVHDRESYIITIRHNQSAWNNKEQGFRKYPR